MLLVIQRYFQSVSPVFLDGTLYILIAMFGALTAAFSSDEAAKYLEDETLFWVRTICGTTSATLLALKMFRSTSYAEHQERKEQEQVEGKVNNG